MQKEKLKFKNRSTRTSLFGWVYLIILVICSVVFSCTNTSNADNITLFVAASLNQTLTDVVSSKDIPPMLINTASSGTLARQINAGAECDVYFSANKRWINYLIQKELADSLKVKVIAKNLLVAVVPIANSASITDSISWIDFAQACQTISMGDPAHVPAGEYAKQALESTGVYKELQTKILETKDVVSALMLVEIGEADLGFVYKSDAVNSTKALLLSAISDTLYQPINYYMAALTTKGEALINDSIFLNQLKVVLTKKGFE
ncbi:MAG: molybdate ABC transporter substrate-binding protein [Salinivirgaceae bacterium]|jgi:molybdate transport system substrate-binding protein|nr:molybdate ABC transporter substrate-binding protein [Salinivirgaceae bacterium]